MRTRVKILQLCKQYILTHTTNYLSIIFLWNIYIKLPPPILGRIREHPGRDDRKTDEQEEGEEFCDMLSPGHKVAIAHMN